MARGKSIFTKLIQTWVTPEQYNAIVTLAGESGTVSKVIRILLAEALKARGL